MRCGACWFLLVGRVLTAFTPPGARRPGAASPAPADARISRRSCGRVASCQPVSARMRSDSVHSQCVDVKSAGPMRSAISASAAGLTRSGCTSARSGAPRNACIGVSSVILTTVGSSGIELVEQAPQPRLAPDRGECSAVHDAGQVVPRPAAVEVAAHLDAEQHAQVADRVRIAGRVTEHRRRLAGEHVVQARRRWRSRCATKATASAAISDAQPAHARPSSLRRRRQRLRAAPPTAPGSSRRCAPPGGRPRG